MHKPQHSFTVEQILNAAEKNRYKNFNDDYIEYDGVDEKGNPKVVAACVIGEAFLNLGLVENGTDARMLSDALFNVQPDDGPISITYSHANYTYYGPKRIEETIAYDNLSYFINDLNDKGGYRGKKRMVALARKYFSKSLQQVVRF